VSCHVLFRVQETVSNGGLSLSYPFPICPRASVTQTLYNNNNNYYYYYYYYYYLILLLLKLSLCLLLLLLVILLILLVIIADPRNTAFARTDVKILFPNSPSAVASHDPQKYLPSVAIDEPLPSNTCMSFVLLSFPVNRCTRQNVFSCLFLFPYYLLTKIQDISVNIVTSWTAGVVLVSFPINRCTRQNVFSCLFLFPYYNGRAIPTFPHKLLQHSV
jgi:hypothetical protein